ncbi:hypothetical protein [Reichenbachiella versicolor]|uniref:hypothetical protein n=1 Tax=Reichenbachiella versicolor TaxID=1821036 RepID=UPI000D6E3AFA|nr:hypothetical protein [Reichenbachiella versicolor]
MDILHELVFVAENYYSKFLNSHLKEGSKLASLYDLVKANEYINDDEVSQILYEGIPTDKKYLMLKRNLMLKLNDVILESDNDAMEYTQLRFQVEKQIIIAEKLLSVNLFHTPEKILKKALIELNEVWFTDLQLRIYKLLRQIYSLKGHKKKLLKTMDKIELLKKLLEKEDEVLSQIQMHESYFNYSCSLNPNQSLEELSSLILTHDHESENHSLEFNLNSLRLRIYLAYGYNDPKQLKTHIDQLRLFLVSTGRLFEEGQRLFVNVFEIRYYLMIQDYPNALKAVWRANELSSYQSFDRFEVSALCYQMYMIQGQYTEAGNLSSQVRSTSQYDRLDPIDKAIWTLRQVLVEILIYLEDDSEGKVLPNWNATEIYETCLPLAKDKTGYNVHLLMIHTILLLLNGDSDVLFDKGNALKVYYQRYLKSTREPRVQLFFKYLTRLCQCKNQEDKVEKLEIKFLEKLYQLDFRDPNEYVSFEVFVKLLTKEFTRSSVLYI